MIKKLCKINDAFRAKINYITFKVQVMYVSFLLLACIKQSLQNSWNYNSYIWLNLNLNKSLNLNKINHIKKMFLVLFQLIILHKCITNSFFFFFSPIIISSASISVTVNELQ